MHQREWQSHNVEVIPFDLRDIHSSITLNPVRTRLVENIFPEEVVADLQVGQGMKPHTRSLQAFQCLLPNLIHYSDGR